MTRDFYARKIFPLGFLMASTLGFGTSPSCHNEISVLLCKTEFLCSRTYPPQATLRTCT